MCNYNLLNGTHHQQGIVWNGKWNGTEILVWNLEDARMEWSGKF